MNVLFPSVGRRVELVNAFRAGLDGLGLDGRLVGTDIDPLAAALRRVDRAYMVPRTDDPDFVPHLVEICEGEEIGLVVPTVDRDIPVLVESRSLLEETGAVVLVPDREASGVTMDKWLTHRFFAQLGVPVPLTWLPDESLAADLAYPVFIKPRRGSAGEHAYKVCDRRQLEFFLDYVPEPIVQEFLPGPEVTSDVLCDLEGRVRAVVLRERIEVRSGEVSKGKTIQNETIMTECARIATALRTRGPITVQCIMREGRPLFTEVNARLGGGLPLGIAAGVHTPTWLLAFAAGIEISTPPLGSYETGLYISRFDKSIIVSEEERIGVESNSVRPRRHALS